MKNVRFFLVLGAALCLMPLAVNAGEESAGRMDDQHDHAVSWGYSGDGAAAHWGDIDEAYHACKDGLTQSPINIAQYAEHDLPALQINYEAVPLHVVNNGHTVQVNYVPDSTVTIEEKIFELQHFHFHTPSEHYIDGAPYAMETHFVHKAEDGMLAVIGVMMKIGMHNPVIEGIWKHIPESAGDKHVEGIAVTAGSLMPNTLEYYAYEGSLTTPPCSEGVKWHVLKEPIEISEAQLITFQNLFPVNARPVQDLHGRVVKGH